MRFIESNPKTTQDILDKVKTSSMTLQQTQRLAAKYRQEIFSRLEPKEDPQGLSPCHMVWMLERVVNDPDMTLDKASRWIGFVQFFILNRECMTLDQLKQSVREARAA